MGRRCAGTERRVGEEGRGGGGWTCPFDDLLGGEGGGEGGGGGGWTRPFDDLLVALDLPRSRIASRRGDVPATNGPNATGGTLASDAYAGGSCDDGDAYDDDDGCYSGIGAHAYMSFLDAINDEIACPIDADASSYGMDDDVDGHATTSAYAATEDAGRDGRCIRVDGDPSSIRLRRERAKDALRGYCHHIDRRGVGDDMIHGPSVPLERTAVAHIVGWLLDAIVVGIEKSHSSRTTASSIADDASSSSSSSSSTIAAGRAASTLRRYLSWADVRISMDATLVRALLDGLGCASSTVEDDEEGVDEDPTPGTILAVECANCLREIVERGTDDVDGGAGLLTRMGILDALCGLSSRWSSSSSAAAAADKSTTQIEAVSASAELINASGLALIRGWEADPTSPALVVQMERCLHLTLTCLAYDSVDVSGAVVDLVSRMLISIEKRGGDWNARLGDGGRDTMETTTMMTTSCDVVVSRILHILHERMRYPDDHAFDHEDEMEAEEEAYRTSLRKVYQRIVCLRPTIALSFMGTCVGNLLASSQTRLSSSPPLEVEVALRLVYHYAEGRRPTPGARTALKDGTFREIVTALHRSDVASHPHWAVPLLYYDVAVRYSDILVDFPEILTLVLGSLTGNGGLQHPRTRVRCRCCYLLLRLIKAVGAKAMRPHVEAVVDGIQTLLYPPPSASNASSIPPDEALYLFEATGILLGTTGLDNEVQVRCAASVLTPHVCSIERTLQRPDLSGDVEIYGEQLSMSISAIAQLSKGWQKFPPPEVQAVLAAAVDVCHKVLVSLPSSQLIRNRTAVLLQRMILCLGEGILPVMPSFFSLLLFHCASEEDVLDASQLINQLCIKFKDKAAESVDGAMIPFLHKVLTIQINGHDLKGKDDDVSPSPHLISHSTEQLYIRKQAFSTLQHIAVHNVSAVLYSERNAASLGDALQLMNDGLSVTDPVIMKTCTLFFCELINQWGRQCRAPPTVSDVFFDFVYGTFVPSVLSRALAPTFNVKDALHSRVFAEFGRALWLLKLSHRGDTEFQCRVVDNLISRGGGFPDIAVGFQNATCEKDVELVLKKWKEQLAQQ
jgi:hypothetical protein